MYIVFASRRRLSSAFLLLLPFPFFAKSYYFRAISLLRDIISVCFSLFRLSSFTAYYFFICFFISLNVLPTPGGVCFLIFLFQFFLNVYLLPVSNSRSILINHVYTYIGFCFCFLVFGFCFSMFSC